MKIRSVSTFSSKGNRPVQEDHVLASRDRGIFVVADGFGGPVAGSEAARMACDAIKSFLFKEAGDLDATLPFELRSYFSLAGNVLFNALVHANRKVCGRNEKKSANEKGGTSVIAGFVDGDLLALANVGACSAWLFRSGQCRELVIPRTLERMRDPLGELPPQAAEEMQVPLMALGMSEDLEPEIVEYQVRPGDWILLQTDGVGSGIRSRLRVLADTVSGPGKGTPPDSVLSQLNDAFESGSYRDNAAATLIVF